MPICPANVLCMFESGVTFGTESGVLFYMFDNGHYFYLTCLVCVVLCRESHLLTCSYFSSMKTEASEASFGLPTHIGNMYCKSIHH